MGITQLAREVPNIVGIKDTIDNISHTREVINRVHAFRPGFIIFSGYDEYMLDTLILGGHGDPCYLQFCAGGDRWDL